MYQRSTRTVGKRQIPYIIAGTGCYGVNPVQGSSFALPYKAHDFTVENMAVELGYLTVTVDMSIDARLIIAFNSPRLGHAIDKVTIDLLTSTVKSIQPDSPPAPKTPKAARSSPAPRLGLKNASRTMRSSGPSRRSGA